MMREGWLFTRDSEDGSALMLEVISPVTYLRRKSEMKTCFFDVRLLVAFTCISIRLICKYANVIFPLKRTRSIIINSCLLVG
jgi:hypothetical protein